MVSAEDRALVVGAFDSCTYPDLGPDLDTAWLGFYQVLLWYDENPLVRALAHGGSLFADAPLDIQLAVAEVSAYLQMSPNKYLLHIREANDLATNRRWMQRAAAAEAYLAAAIGVTPADLPGRLDRMMRLPRWQGQQRNNPLGNGLRILLAEVLRRWGSSAYDYEEETKATVWFPGIELAGRSRTPSIDVAATRNGVPRVVMSCKWSIRHDRVSDPTNECTEYRAAGIKRQIMNLRYYVITNELDGQRLDKLLNQPCVTGVVHIHLDMVETVTGFTGLMVEERKAGRLLDLTELVRHTATWG